jgi:hypothetical protein
MSGVAVNRGADMIPLTRIGETEEVIVIVSLRVITPTKRLFSSTTGSVRKPLSRKVARAFVASSSA